MPNQRRKQVDHSLLEMALVGYESAKDAIDQKISEIKRMIGGGSRAIAVAVETYTTPKKRRTLSGKARRAISMAQKKRWSNAKKAVMATVKTAKKKVKKTIKGVKAKAAEVVPV